MKNSYINNRGNMFENECTTSSWEAHPLIFMPPWLATVYTTIPLDIAKAFPLKGGIVYAMK